MKVMSYNVRGFLIKKEGVKCICIQETKMQTVDMGVCNQIWGDSNFDWRFIPAVERPGGVLCVWNRDIFKVDDWFNGLGFIGLIGVWGDPGIQCVLVTVYASCIAANRRS